MNNIVVSTVCIFSLVIGILSLYESELYSIKQNKKFMIIAVIIIFDIIIDTISLEMDGKISGKLNIYKSIKIIEFITVPLIPTILASLVARKVFWKEIRKYFYVLIVINIIAQAITFFKPLMFNIDEHANYSRTVFTNFYIIILILCFVLLIISSYKTFIQNTAKISFTLLSINALLLFGTIIRYFNVKSNSDWLCITLSYFIFIIDFSNSYLKIDPSTSLLNRRAFNNKLSNIKYSTALIIIDANNFKSINDSYGHQCGDWALSKIAETIFSIYNKVGYCYRIGGDEFCVILKPGMLKKLTYQTENMDTYVMLESLIELLDKKLAEIAKSNNALRFGVSQGYGIYYSLQDNPAFKKYKTIEEVFKIADKRMYSKKAKSKIIYSS